MMTQTELVYFGTCAIAAIVGVALMFKSTHKRKEPDYPRPLETFFEEGRCPNCGQGAGFFTWPMQKGGADNVLECPRCQSVFAISYPPLQCIEQIGGRVTKDISNAKEEDPRSSIHRATRTAD